MPWTPRRLQADDPALPAVLVLLKTSYAAMEGRIDPPSSVTTLTVETLSEQARDGELWVIGERPVACVLLTPQPDHLYLSRVATDRRQRGKGLMRALVELAGERARDLGLPALELRSRVELTENHTAFVSVGFRIAGEMQHPGFDHTTSLIFRKDLGSSNQP